MKKIFSAVLIIISSGSLTAQTIQEGRLNLDEKQYNHARAIFYRILSKSPENDSAWCFLGDVYLALHKQDSAEACYNKAVSVNPENPLCQIESGKFALMKGNRDMAIEIFDKVRKADRKRDIEIPVSIARACMVPGINDTLMAHIYLNDAAGFSKLTPDYFATLGDLYFTEGNLGLASVNYESAIYYDPNNAYSYYKLGNLYKSVNNYTEAYDAYKKAIEIKPGLIKAYKNLGDLCFSHGVYGEAEKSFSTYLQRSDYSMEDQERYALILFFTKEFNKADSVLMELIRGRTDNPVMYRIEGYIAYEKAEYEKGLKYMDHFFRIQRPEKILASDYEYYGNLLHKNSQDSLALVYLQKAIDTDSTKAYNYLTMAKIYSQKEDHARAINCYRLVTAGSAQEILNVNFSLGSEYFYAGNEVKSEYDSLVKAVEKQKSSNSLTETLKEKYISLIKSADSCFANVTRLSSKSYLGYLWRARSLSLLDPESITDSAKIMYNKVFTIVESNEGSRNNKVIIECYRYFGSYYFFKSDREKKTDPATHEADKASSKEYFAKILEIDPNDQQAKTVLLALNQNK